VDSYAYLDMVSSLSRQVMKHVLLCILDVVAWLS